MDIDAFFDNNGQKQILNPNYNPRSKKNQEPRTLLVPDLNPRHSTAVGLALEDYAKQQTVDSELADKYRKEGINFNQEEYESGIYDKQLAERQSAGEKTWNALKQTVWGEMILGTIGAFANLFDAISGAAFKSDNDYQNSLSAVITEAQERFKENNPIYTDPDKTFGDSAMSDWGWWMSNIPSIASSLTLLIPARAVTGGLKLIGKGVAATRKAKNVAGRVRTANEMEKMSKLRKALRNENNNTIAGRLFENGVSALTMRTLENYQEAAQTYNDMYKQASDSLNNMTPEEYQEFLNRNASELNNYDGDLNDRDNVAKQIASNSADRTFIEDYSNIFWDVLQVSMLRNPLKYAKNMRKTAAINASQRETIAATLKSSGKELGKKYENTLLNRTKNAITDRFKAIGIVAAELSEGVEEAVNYIAQQEGLTYGNLMLNPDSAEKDFSKRFNSYLHNADLWEAAFWGVLGGVGFQLGGSGFNRIGNAVKGKVADKKSKNDKTKESKEGIKDKINWKERFETPENKARTEKMNKRVVHFNTLRERLNAIDNKTNPFENNATITDEDQESLRNRAINEYITDIAFDAIDSGTWNLTKDYLRDADIQQVLKKVGVIDNTSGDVENLIKKMDLVERRYNDNMIMLGGISAAIDDETPYEYLQLIARDNTINQMKLDYIDDTIKDYELKAEEHKKIFENNLQEGLDYKGAIDLIATSERLGDLLYRKEQIFKDKKYSNSIAGQSELNNINKQINLIGQHLVDVANNTQDDTTTLAKMLWTVGRATQFNLDEVTGNVKFDNTKDSYVDFLSTLATRDAKSINKLLSDIFGNINIVKTNDALAGIQYEQEQKSFKLTDENIIEIFGEGETGRGKYHNINQLIGDAINIKNGIQTKAKDLNDDYVILSNLNLKRLQLISQIANTTDSVNAEINEMHNYMNQARSKAISQSRDTIFKIAKQFGAREVSDYIFYNQPENLLNKEDFKESDRKQLDDAVSILNLTSRNNKKLGETINSLLNYADIYGFEEEKIIEEQEKQDKKQEGTTEKKSSTPETGKLEPKTSEPYNPPQQEKKLNRTENIQQKQPISEQLKAQPKAQPRQEEKDKQLEINVGLDGSIRANQNEKSNDTFGYKYKSFDNGNRLVVLAKETQEDTEIPKEQLAKKELYDGFDANNPNTPKIISNPVLIRNDNGGYDVLVKGALSYESETTAQTSSTGVAEQTTETKPEVDENGVPVDSSRALVVDKYRAQAIKDSRSKISEIGKDKITEEQFNKIFDDLAEEYKQTSTETNSIDDGVLAAKQALQKVFFRNGFAQATGKVLTSEITEVASDSSIVYTKEYKNAVNQMLDDYCKDFNIKAIDGKRYVRLEDILRRVNSLYDDKATSDRMYSELIEYLNKDYNGDIVLIDKNNENIRTEAKKTITQKLDEIISVGDSQRIDIDSFFENPTDSFKKAFDSLRVGDNLTIKSDNKDIILYKNGTPIGRLPLPQVDSSTGAMSKTNMGWLTKVWYDANDKQTHSNLQPIFREILLHNSEVTNNIYGTILILNYDNSLNEDIRKSLQEKLYNYLNTFINDTFGKTVNPIDKNANHTTVVKHICNLFKYFDINSVTPEEQLANINDSLNKWFEKLYNSYKQINDIATGNLKTNGFQVTKITSGELISDVKYDGKSHYDEYTQSTEALANPDDAILTIVNPNDEKDTLSTKPITLAKEQIDKRNSRGTIYVVIPKNNVDKKDHYNYDEIDTIIGTSVRPNDTKAKGDVKQVFKAIRKELDTLVDNYFDNPTIDNYNALEEFCRKVFYNTTKKDNNLLLGVTPNISLVWGVTYIRNSNSENGFRLQREGQETLNIIPPKDITDEQNLNTNVAVWRRTNNKGEFIDGFANNESKEALKKVLFNLFNNSIFNVSAEHILGDNNNSEPNGLITRDKTTREITITIPDSKTGKPLVKKYANFNELVIKGGFIRLNTHVENGSNYRRKGENQGGNQILEAKPIIDNTTPVEESNEVVGKDAEDVKRFALNTFFDDNNQAKVDAIIDFVFPELDKETKNNIKNLGLLPKSIIFAKDLNHRNNENGKLVGPNAQAILSKQITQVGEKWLEMFTEVGDFANVPEGLGKLQATRKLIHEQIHHKLHSNEEQYKYYIDKIQEIYDEFEQWLNENNIPEDSHIREYLFKNKKDNEERLEEFLVESLTSEELVNQLNQIESKVEKANKKTKTIWEKLIDLINKLFGWNVNEGSLREKELEIFRKQFRRIKPKDVPNQMELDFTENVEQVEQEKSKEEQKQTPKLSGPKIPTRIHGKVKGSTITEVNNGYTNEMNEIRSKTIADGTFMKAPNGNPTNLNERQWLQVRTKAFKDWFGDWENNLTEASKVVDDNGEPLVVYHGSKNGNFTTFDYYYLNKTDSGFFFTSDKSYANNFGNTREFFLNIKNPNITETYLDLDSVETLLTTEFKIGTDGIIGHDNPNTGENIKSTGIEYVALRPNQIKSATDNIGTFSRENNDIRYSEIEESKIYPSVTDAIATIEPQNKARFIREINDAEIQTKCK